MSRPNDDGVAGPSAGGVHLSDDAADRLLSERLSRLSSGSSAIRVTMPPPSAQQLESRLAKLNGPTAPVVDEEELQRRFDRLNGGGSGGGATSGVAPVPLYSSAELRLAGHGARRTEQEEADELFEQMQAQYRLEQAPGGLPTTSAASVPASSFSSGPSASPPPPTRDEVDALMRQLDALPADTTFRGQPHLAVDGRTRAGSSEDDDEDDEDDAVRRIVNQARDEARMGL